MPSTSSTISNGGNWFTERTWGPFTGVAENPPRLTSREAAYPGHFRMSPNHGRSRSFSARKVHHITRLWAWRAGPVFRGSSRASIPTAAPSVPRSARMVKISVRVLFQALAGASRNWGDDLKGTRNAMLRDVQTDP